MFLITGLGNPGVAYAGTRHNAGFMAVDCIARQHGIKIGRIRHKALIGEGMIGGQKVILAKPQTYMNLSGLSLRQLAAYYKIQPDHILVIYDDIDIDVGRIRVRREGSSGTHNGMRSIVAELGTESFPRIRVGIGNGSNEKITDFVLNKVSKTESELFARSVADAAEAAEMIMLLGIDKAMNEYNRKDRNGLQAEKDKREKEETE